MGVFMPFFRAHAHHDCPRREPFMFEKPICDIIRSTINLRYKLLPYMYYIYCFIYF